MQQLEFQLRGEFVELNQLLKLSGVCDSGGAGKALVAEGVVSVDGKVELRKTAKIRAGSVVALAMYASVCWLNKAHVVHRPQRHYPRAPKSR